MKYAPILVALLFATFAYADNSFTPTDAWDGVKETYVPDAGPAPTLQGGEDIATAVPITIPGYYIGTNGPPYVHNYDEVCPYGPHTTPDVVYSYNCTNTMDVIIDMCNSWYDTKVFVYANMATPGNPVACNDDYCSGPNYPYSYVSYLQFQMVAGNTYYIVIDGYSGSTGTYEMDIQEFVIQPICDGTEIEEGEPDCYPGYNDMYNGGCNSSPYIFQTVECPCEPVAYCGESGGWDSGYTSYRDTDWYEITLDETKLIETCVTADFNVLVFLLDGNPTPGPDPCLDGDIIITYSTAAPYVELCLVWTFAPGTYWVWVGPSSFGPDAATCGVSQYKLTLTGYCENTGAESASWGKVKEIFR
jgi:hypothetical protein